ncbi:MAG: cytochrome c oxidase assembly protein [Rhodospirillaceae bacterium]|nr:cytochrome c oxidase assembly protein [Rhodospirillaceae bacterium]MDE0618520.1 cytochrome c oxidase assembly protein [Rhodospirillaceae bacterium]
MAARGSLAKGKRNTVLGVLAILSGMTLLVVYAVPLYEMFCRATGFGGTTQRAAAAPETAAGRTITVRFLANTNPNLPWRFQPAVDSVRVAVGKRRLVAYTARNLDDSATTGIATFNVTPAKAGVYFTKIACFCFDEQTLKPGQAVNMPVSFFIDPAIAKDRNLRDVDTITLSYTFFRAAGSDSEDGRAEDPARTGDETAARAIRN